MCLCTCVIHSFSNDHHYLVWVDKDLGIDFPNSGGSDDNAVV